MAKSLDMNRQKTISVLLAGLLLALSFPASGQVGFQSYDPVGDSVVVARMRSKMDRIRRRRPTVAVVLNEEYEHVDFFRDMEQYSRLPHLK